MRSPAAQILETALALQRAPGERFRLRERPLPAGIIHLAEVAAGSQQALQAAADELGESEPMLVEAARFYLEQVLFADPHANAYRVLGVAPEASSETIRVHHRWLQRWLHPDRAVAGDASVFATRVNQAFAQLRTPELRHQYDVRLAEARMAGATAPLASETLRRWEHGDEVVATSVGRRSRWLLAAALASCAVLAVLIVRNPENAGAWQPEGDEAEQAARQAHDTPALEDRDFGILSDALSAPPAPTPPPPAQPAPAQPAPEPDVQSAAPLRQQQAFVPARQQAPTPVPVAARPSTSPPAQTSRLVQAAGVELRPSPSQKLDRKAAPPADTASPQPSAQLVDVAASGGIPESSDAAPATPAPDVTAERMRLAEQGIAQVVGYFDARPDAFPLWNDPVVETRATQLRGALNARKGSFELRDVAWKVGAGGASLDAAYRCQPTAKGNCEGRLLVDLVWRQGYWFVRRVSLAPSA